MAAIKKDNAFVTITKNIGRGLFIAVVVLILFYIILTVFFPRKVIDIFKYQNFVITSGSMSPTIEYGDMVIVKKVDPHELQEEDIITFYADVNASGKKVVVTHYVAQITTDDDGKLYFRTHRENSTIYDSWLVGEEDIVGIKVGQINKIGKVILYIQSGFGLSILIVDIIIIFLIIQLILSLNDGGKDKYKKNKDLLRKYRNKYL